MDDKAEDTDIDFLCIRCCEEVLRNCMETPHFSDFSVESILMLYLVFHITETIEPYLLNVQFLSNVNKQVLGALQRNQHQILTCMVWLTDATTVKAKFLLTLLCYILLWNLFSFK